jgi:hypothetical protein
MVAWAVMGDDPWKIFKSDPSRQNTLNVLWPDLYNCLADLDAGGPPRVLKCVLAPHATGKGPPAVARVSDQFGPPACRSCIDRIHGKGHPGWPLKREKEARR